MILLGLDVDYLLCASNTYQYRFA